MLQIVYEVPSKENFHIFSTNYWNMKFLYFFDHENEVVCQCYIYRNYSPRQYLLFSFWMQVKILNSLWHKNRTKCVWFLQQNKVWEKNFRFKLGSIFTVDIWSSGLFCITSGIRYATLPLRFTNRSTLFIPHSVRSFGSTFKFVPICERAIEQLSFLERLNSMEQLIFCLQQML